jgi:HPt (histidine-containing phosphotransfer) domain-containing protein
METLPIFDKEAVMERLDNDEELLSELLNMLFEDADDRIAEIATAGSLGNSTEVEKRAHSIKSALGNLGALRAHKAAHNLEIAGRSNNLQDIDQLVAILSKEYNAFKESVISYVS